MICSGVWISFAPSSRHIAFTVLIGAKKRSAFLHALGDVNFLRIKAVWRSLRIARYPIALKLCVVIRAIPVGNPLPDISRHVVEAKLVEREGCDRRYPSVSIFGSILVGEMSLKGVGHPFTSWIELITPGIGLPVAAATRSELPLGLGGKSLVRPLRVSHGIRPCDLDYGIFFFAGEIAARALRMLPVRASDKSPPRQRMIERHRPRWRREDHRSGS